VPRPELARDRGFSEQFRREARAAARLAHPNVVAVYDSGEERGLPWIVMEHVSGQTLRQLLDARGRLDPETVAELLGPVADALDHAHHAGIAHLDIKPENVLLARDSVKVADFGLVRAAAQGGHGQALAATLPYCAPEVLRGGLVDGRADVYALGVVAWECLVGRPPFDGDQDQVVQQHLHGRVPAPSLRVEGVPAALDAAVLHATDPDPARRYPRASDFAAAIGAPRRRRVDEALQAAGPPSARDTTVEPFTGARQPPGPAPAGPAWQAGTQAPTMGWPAAPPAPLRPRPTTGRVPKTRAGGPGRRRWQVLAVTAVSPAVPVREVEEAKALAAFLQARHRLLRTAEMAEPNYVANPVNRCYFCKRELYGRLARLAAAEGYAAVVDGANRDDLSDWRPGRIAAGERAVLSPLVEAGFTKAEIRAASHALGLPTWDKPAMACLSSRFPYGTPITPEKLRQVDQAEAFVRSLGFRNFRVRHHGDLARLEVDATEVGRLWTEGRAEAIAARLSELGFVHVTVDLRGFRSGSLNDALLRLRAKTSAPAS